MPMRAWKVTALASRYPLKRGQLKGSLTAAFQLHVRRALPGIPTTDAHQLRNLSGSPFKHRSLFVLRLGNVQPQGPRSVRSRTGIAAASSGGEQDSNATLAAQQSLAGRLLQVLKRVAKVLAGFALVALLAAAALPSILSTGPGLQAGTALVSRFLPASVCVQQADLGWNKRIKLSGVEFTSPAILGGETLASVETVSTTETLWNVVRGRSFDAFASRPRLDCSLASSGQLKWAELLDYATGKAALSAEQAGAFKNSVEVTKAAELPFTAEGRFLSGSLYASDGILTLPRELKEVLGRDLHLTAVIGANNLHASADELSLDTAWVETDTPADSLARHQGQRSPEAAGQQLPASIEQPSISGAADGGGAGRGALVSSDSLPLDPTIIAIRSEHLDFEAAGWRRTDGRLLLRRPAKAQLQFTPALAQFGLALLSPLLSGVLAVEEGTVGLTVMPAGMVAPAESYHLRIAPLRVAVSRQDLLARAIQFLRLKEGGEIAQKSLLQGMTSAVRIDLSEQGAITSKRLDLLVSPGGRSKGVHLCSWGRVDPVTSSLDIALGVPADTLKLVGIKHVDRDAMLVIPVRGTSSSPRVDWVEAYKRLAAFAAEQPVEPKSLQGRLLRGIVQGLDLRANHGLVQDWEVPAPVEVLPWEEDSQVLHGTEVKVDSSTVTDADHE